MSIDTNFTSTSQRQVNVANDVWFLSGATRPGDGARHIAIDEESFVVGRKPNLGLSLGFNTVSSAHASLWVEGGNLWLQDLGSTNGTFVNGQRIDQPIQLGEEDLVHFAEALFRVRLQSVSEGVTGTISQNVCDQALALVQFDRLMSQRLVVPHFQPIVKMDSPHELLGLEILGRGRVFGLESVSAMFEAASQLDLEVDLSQMLRWEGVRVGRNLPDCPILFVNTHPSELVSEGLEQSLDRLADMAGNTHLVLEIHESAVTSPQKLRHLQDKLQELEIGLAYDDFGAGQARLSELVQARPEYVKFDMSLISGIDSASPERRQMLQTLVKMVRELNIKALAEGIETEAEAEYCQEIGFDLAQGFLFGRPVPMGSLDEE